MMNFGPAIAGGSPSRNIISWVAGPIFTLTLRCSCTTFEKELTGAYVPGYTAQRVGLMGLGRETFFFFEIRFYSISMITNNF